MCEAATSWAPFAVVMDYVPLTLGSLISTIWNSRKDGSTPIPLHDDVVHHLLQGLILCLQSFHHRLKLVHGDLKPDNVFILSNASFAKWKSDPRHLLSARILLGDLATVTPEGTEFGDGDDKAVRLGKDDFKSPEIVDRTAITTHWSQDQFALGKIAAELLKVAPECAWLEDAIRELTDHRPGKRPASGRDLCLLVRPDGVSQRDLWKDAGWNSPKHTRLVGRRWVRDEFAGFCRKQNEKNCGGIFIIEAEPGVGKSAILTHWAVKNGIGVNHPSPLWPAYYFRYAQQKQDDPNRLPEVLGKQLLKLPGLNFDHQGEFDGSALNKIANEAARSANSDNPLILIVDGLDECSNPTEACRIINCLELPAYVFLVIGCRPVGVSGKCPHGTIENSRKTVLRIDRQSQRNLNDARDFWKLEWLGIPESIRAQSGLLEFDDSSALDVAKQCGGIFEILRSALSMISEGQLTLKEFRTAGTCDQVNHWHHHQWERIHDNSTEDRREKILCLISLLIVAQDFLSEKQILDILRWDNSTGSFNSTIAATRWLLDVKSHHATKHRYFRLSHKSVVDYFTASEQPLENAQPDMHSRVANHYLRFYPENLSNLDDYGCRFLVKHCLAASAPLIQDADRYLQYAAELLCDLEFLKLRIRKDNKGQ